MSAVTIHPRAACCWCDRKLVQILERHWVCVNPPCAERQFSFATAAEVTKGPQKGQIAYLYVPTPRQAEWHGAVYDRKLQRVLVGGAAGPGKSRWMRETLYRLAKQVPGLHALLLRRTVKDLEQSHLRFMPVEVEQRGGQYLDSKKIAVFSHGKGQPQSIIRAGHLVDDSAIVDYLSSEYDVIAPDELVTFEREQMIELFTRARSTNPALKALRGTPGPSGYDGSMVIASTNPGGRGALWIKDFFIDKTPHDVEDYDPQEWAFFDARLIDNPYITEKYERSLRNMSPIRRRQLLSGDWTAFEGQFFGEFEPYRTTPEGRVPHHVVRRTLDPSLEYFASMDWGYNAPGAVLWWACLLDGHYHLIHEHKFQQESVETVGKAIRRITHELGLPRVRYIACDPAMKQRTGAGKGESIFETLARMGLPMRASDNNRFNGWQRVHELLREDVSGQPWLTVDPGCAYLLRTLPSQMQDEHDPDDLDTTGEDHAVDALRYGAMSRPSPTRLVMPPPPKGTMGAMMDQVRREAAYV